jgi:hypothetical protein
MKQDDGEGCQRIPEGWHRSIDPEKVHRAPLDARWLRQSQARVDKSG